MPLLIEYGRKLYPPLSLAAARITALQRNGEKDQTQSVTTGTTVPNLPVLPEGHHAAQLSG
jgi:hypothetical protein